ncbi:NAD(P)-dependent malic enzyme [Melissococcus plutonius]|uniref:NAD(P)-dependent malic enzyme n=1 Tax=Melissococcus plutonius TaxID=33970 RepID=UPI003EE56A06
MNEEMLEIHKKHTGVLSIQPKLEVKNGQDLAKAYTPGVADLSLLINKEPNLARQYTVSGKVVAVITDGSAVLGLGNVGEKAGLPIVEGKALLYKTFADVDAFPLAIRQQSIEEIVRTIVNIQDSFGGIHLEDIAAPKCFEIEQLLQEKLTIPVYHDDQEGTAIVVFAALINAAKLAGKSLTDLKVVVNGLGASGVATTKLLLHAGIKKITLLDKQGILTDEDTSLNSFQRELVLKTEGLKKQGNLTEGIMDQDVFIGLSEGNLLTEQMVRSMANDPIIFALANPIPEILPEEAKKGGARLIATGSSNYPNQVNNVLAFPGLFKGLLENNVKKVTLDLEEFVARKLANLLKTPLAEKFIPQVFDKEVVQTVAQAVSEYQQTNYSE